jgi:hypothetical protein
MSNHSTFLRPDNFASTVTVHEASLALHLVVPG